MKAKNPKGIAFETSERTTGQTGTLYAPILSRAGHKRQQYDNCSQI